MIKIISGWSDKGGSTIAFIALTKELNKRGYDTTFYGPHTWHLDKCKSGMFDQSVVSNLKRDDIVICHFLNLQNRPNVKKIVLSCHEKNLFRSQTIFQKKVHRNS